MINKRLLFLLLAVFPLYLLAQDVSGIVVDENGEPLVGVSVLVRGTSLGTITDIDGAYSLSIPQTDKRKPVVVFSYVGFLSKEMSADELVFNEGIFLDIIAYLRDFFSRMLLIIGAAMIVIMAAKKTT